MNEQGSKDDWAEHGVQTTMDGANGMVRYKIYSVEQKKHEANRLSPVLREVSRAQSRVRMVQGGLTQWQFA